MSVPKHNLKVLVTALLLFSFCGQSLTAHAAAAEVPAMPREIAKPGEVATPGEVEVITSGESPQADASAAGNSQGTTLTGDWGGTRKRLYDGGVQADLVYKADLLGNAAGGIERRGTYMGNVSLTLQFDGDKLVGWKGGFAYLQAISDGGGKLNLNYVGSLMGVDNIETLVNRTGIFKAWLQQSLLDDKASLLIGLYPIDTEFYVTDSSGVFIHPSFGMAAEVAASSTRAVPSIFPTSSYGARLRIQPDPVWYAMFAITQGIPTNTSVAYGPNIKWKQGSGSMIIGEVGLSPAAAGLIDGHGSAEAKQEDDFQVISKVALGIWCYTPRFPQLIAGDDDGRPLLATHWGTYILIERTVYRVPDSDRSAAVFVRYGLTDGKTSIFDYSTSVGLTYKGLFPSRPNDTFGIAVTYGHAGVQFRQAWEPVVGPLSSNAETAVEMTYQAQLLPGLVLQPVVQRIFNPSLYLPSATVGGFRLQMAF